MRCTEKANAEIQIFVVKEKTHEKTVFLDLNYSMQVRKILTVESYFSGVITSVTIENSSAPIEKFLATVGQRAHRDFWATLYFVQCIFFIKRYTHWYIQGVFFAPYTFCESPTVAVSNIRCCCLQGLLRILGNFGWNA